MAFMDQSSSSWHVAPLDAPFGVEVRGVDLRQGFGPEDQERFRQLFDAHNLLLLRDQRLDGDDQLRFCRYLRPVVDPVAWVSNVEDGFHPEVELLYHCDYAFTAHPMLGLSLYAVELGEGAASTRYASNVRGLRTLPADLRSELQSLNVVHLIDTINGRHNVRTCLEDVGGAGAPTDLYPRFSRPVIWTHPVLGVDLLFALEQQASHFEGRSCADSGELFHAVFAHLYGPDNVYEHEWRIGDLIVWDNLALQHGRRANPITVRRSLRRVAMHTVTTAELIAGTGFDPVHRAAAAAAAQASSAMTPSSVGR
jgi:taurine dioxygenase